VSNSVHLYLLHKRSLINHSRLEEKNIGFEPDEPGLRWQDKSAKTLRISVQLDEDQIFQAATDYQSWTNGTYVFENLPRFDNATISDLTLEDENTMIKKEIAKFAEFASSDKPSLFKSNGILSTTNPEGLKDLAKVLDQIKTHLQVIRHDNSLLILENLPHYSIYKTFKMPEILSESVTSKIITGRFESMVANRRSWMTKPTTLKSIMLW